MFVVYYFNTILKSQVDFYHFNIKFFLNGKKSLKICCNHCNIDSKYCRFVSCAQIRKTFWCNFFSVHICFVFVNFITFDLII